MPCVRIKTEDSFKKLVNSGKFVIVDFKADWCTPCVQIAQIYEEMSEEAEFSKITFGIVDVDEKGTLVLTTKEGIRSMPTFIVYKDGVVIKRTTGANEENVRKMLKEVLQGSNSQR